jgi:hypothetical protein
MQEKIKFARKISKSSHKKREVALPVEILL